MTIDMQIRNTIRTETRLIYADTIAVPTAPPTALPYSRKNPFLAELTRHDRLTRAGSLKDTRHFVLNLAGSGLTYTPGDSLGAFGRNSPELVDEVIGLLGLRRRSGGERPAAASPPHSGRRCCGITPSTGPTGRS